jgi:hypothetical protein
MKPFPSFVEYMDAKGKVVEKPDVELVPDYKGPEEKSPPNSKVPYKTPVANKKPAEGEDGLADMGDDKLKYEPTKGSKYEVKKDVMKEYMDEKGKVLERGREDIKGDYKSKVPASPQGGNSKPYIAGSMKAGEKGLGDLGHDEFKYEPDTKKAPKVEKSETKTENFLNKTKGMSISEFTKYMLKECGCGQVEGEDMPYVTAYSTGKIQPHPPEVIRYISALANKNGGILENLVSQMVSAGYLNTLLKTIFQYPQAYEELTSLFGDEEGPSRCKSFVGAMNNSYSKFLSDQEGMYESVSSPVGFEDEFDSEDDHDGDDEFDSEDDHEGDDEFDSEDDHDGDDEFDSEDDHDGDDEFDSEEDHEGDDEFGSEEDHDSEEVHSKAHENKKLKKKFAHDHLLGAMKDHEHMLKKMREI